MNIIAEIEQISKTFGHILLIKQVSGGFFYFMNGKKSLYGITQLKFSCFIKISMFHRTAPKTTIFKSVLPYFATEVLKNYFLNFV